MNEELATFARKYLKENLPKCTEGERHVFKQMYYPQHPDRSIDEAVDKMPDEKLDWAMSQLKNTLEKHKKDETNDGRIPEAKKES